MRNPYVVQTEANMQRKMKTENDARTLIFNISNRPPIISPCTPTTSVSWENLVINCRSVVLTKIVKLLLPISRPRAKFFKGKGKSLSEGSPMLVMGFYSCTAFPRPIPFGNKTLWLDRVVSPTDPGAWGV